MKIKTVEKANKILEEIRELEKCRKIAKEEFFKNSAHFELCSKKYYTDSGIRAHIPKRYNKRLLSVVDEIIAELKDELENIK